MGGFGSGRTYWRSGKALVDEQRTRLDVRAMHRRGAVGNGCLWVRTHSGTLEVEWTRCNYGGSRPWFRCPRCSRRCAVLYPGWIGIDWACRTCLDLAYRSQRLDDEERLRWKAMRLRMRLGELPLLPILDAPMPEKPPRMHRRTYERLVAECEEAEDAYEEAFWNGMRRICARLGIR